MLVNHYPLVREPTRVLRYPQFAEWCGTTRTRDWHVRFNVAAVIYGHLHIPRTTWYDGVRFRRCRWAIRASGVRVRSPLTSRGKSSPQPEPAT